MYKTCIFSSLLINSTVLERITLFVRQQTVVCKGITYLYYLQSIQIGDKTRSSSHYSSPKTGIKKFQKNLLQSNFTAYGFC